MASRLKKSGHGGTHIPYSTMENLLIAFVRSYAATKRAMKKDAADVAKMAIPPKYRRRFDLNVSLTLYKQLESLEGVCRPEDIGDVAQAIESLCANSEWSRELDK